MRRAGRFTARESTAARRIALMPVAATQYLAAQPRPANVPPVV
jgi:hypothetical protein